MAASPRIALVVSAHGGRDVLKITESELPGPGPDEVQVRVTAGGINFADVYNREGVYPSRPPYVSGSEGAGLVVAVGDAVSAFAVGAPVAWASQPGSHASLVNVRADIAVKVPDDVPLDLAAAAMLQGMTAHYLVNSTYRVAPGDSVLIHAAAGGVGQLLVQLVLGRGARVIAHGRVSGEAGQGPRPRCARGPALRPDRGDGRARRRDPRGQRRPRRLGGL